MVHKNKGRTVGSFTLIIKNKMNLTEHYKELYESSIKKIEKGDYLIDLLIDSPADRRCGITLLIRPPENIKIQIQKFLDKLKQVDPSQYYYPESDIHITVMSIVSCYDGFKLEQIAISDYINLIEESLNGIDSLQIKLKGITASDSGIIVQGFPENDTLNKLRDNLRANFKKSLLEQSIDKRYSIKTVHSTVVRFRKPIQKRDSFVEFLERNKNVVFGTFEVKELELVFNDWYLREEKTKLLANFKI